jgi:hypothetical protein
MRVTQKKLAAKVGFFQSGVFVSRLSFRCTFEGTFAMLFYRNFMYWMDKRTWKYVFLLLMLELSVTSPF